MVWLEEHPTSGHFKICFRSGGRKRKETVKTTDRGDPETAAARFNENLNLLERGRLELPPGADIGTFLLAERQDINGCRAIGWNSISRLWSSASESAGDLPLISLKNQANIG